MARPRMPLDQARAKGAHLKDPQRFRDRKAPKVGPLGDPPERLTEDEAEAWLTLAEEIPWLGSADRLLVETAARLAVLMRTEFKAAYATELRQMLSAMGATPAARSKVTAPDEEDDDPAAAYFN
jgi:hypothetical protein